MNQRQRDHFLWVWSRRRAPGAWRIALRGAIIGALGGLLFCVIMLASMGAPPASGYTGLAVIIPALERAWLLVTLSLPVFTVMGFVGARRIYSLQEHQYQSLLQAGARVPTQPPTLQTADRWPAIAVGIVFVVMAVFIGYLIWAHSTGRL